MEIDIDNLFSVQGSSNIDSKDTDLSPLSYNKKSGIVSIQNKYLDLN